MARPSAINRDRRCAAVMRWAWTLALIVVAMLCLPETARTEAVSFYGGRVSFALPAQFRSMTAQELALKYSRHGSPPEFAYTADDTLGISIAVGRLPFGGTEPINLDRFVDEVARGLESVLPDVNWKEREVITVNAVDWASLEFTFEAPDQAVYSRMLLRPADGTVYTFTCNTVVRRLDEFRPVFDSVVGSLRFGP